MKITRTRRLSLWLATMAMLGLVFLTFAGAQAADSLAEAAVTSDIKSLTTGDIERGDYNEWLPVLMDLRWSAVQVTNSLALILLVGGSLMVYLLLSKSVTRDFERADLGHYWLSVLTRYIYWSLLSGLVLIASAMVLNWWFGNIQSPSLGGVIRIGIGIVMSLIFLVMVIAPFGKLRKSLEQSDWEGARRALVGCRWLILAFVICGIVLAAISSLSIDPVSFE